MLIYLTTVLLIAFATVFTIQLADKWGLIDKGRIHGPKWLAKVLGCIDLCLPFWVSTLFGLIFAFLAGDIMLIFAGVFAVPIYNRIK